MAHFYTTEEDRLKMIQQYAHNWYEIRMKFGIPGDEKSDWDKAENIVDAEHPRHIDINLLREGGY